MHNPSYLIQSRHGIYYFRYPLKHIKPAKKGRVSLSLHTRCPKEALAAARFLETVAALELQSVLMNSADIDISSLVREYFQDKWKAYQNARNKKGPLKARARDSFVDGVEFVDRVLISEDYLDPALDESELWEDFAHPVKAEVDDMLKKHSLSYTKDSEEYASACRAYLHGLRAYYKRAIKYSDDLCDFDVPVTTTAQRPLSKRYVLKDVLKEYSEQRVQELGEGRERALAEEASCLRYLIEYLGEDFDLSQINAPCARELKGALMKTPNHRAIRKKIKNLPLREQIKVAGKHKLEPIGVTTVNKYIGYFSAFCKWASDNGYIASNPFDKIKLKANHKAFKQRHAFSSEEVRKIIAGISFDESQPSRYWGVLLAVYTGARRGEISQLLPGDVMQDEASGIWYVQITDEEDKKLKSEAACRFVPVHSKLLEHGFLDYLQHAQKVSAKRTGDDGRKTRLLYDLKYNKHDGWGRYLGRWFNETYLPELGLKADKKSLHSLRHSFITNLSASDVEVETVQNIVGHEPQTVTHQSYMHLGVQHLPKFKDAIEKLRYI